MRVLQHFCHPAGCVAPFFSHHDGTLERPKQRPAQTTQSTSRSQTTTAARRSWGWPCTGQQLPTSICQQPRSVKLDPSMYLSITLHPLHLSLPLHLERTLTLQRQIPSLYPFPQQQVIYRHLSSVLVQLGETRTTCQKKKQSRSLGGKWWGYYWYVAVILKFLHNNISITEAAWKAWRSNFYAFGNVPRPWKHCPISSSTMILPLFTNYQCRPSSMFSSDLP